MKISEEQQQDASPPPHESAAKHVTGEAVYVDDMLVNEQLLVGRVVTSPHAHARIRSFDLSEARSMPGVHAVLSFRDIPGLNQMGPVVKDEPCLARDEVVCVGQAVFLIAAGTEEEALEAGKRIRVDYELLEPVLTLEQAIERESLLGPPAKIERGDVDAALQQAPHVVRGELRTGAQEHWYLESQVCLCIPGEGREMNVYSSTQHPSETQHLIAGVLGLESHEVVVEVRRMGGAFGGKETQANHTACWCALLASATGRPVKIRLFRDDDMKMTGKRHRFLTNYRAGFAPDGTLLALDVDFHADGGCATDLSFAILQRAMLHADNAYFVPAMRVLGRVYRTNLPSNTAFRGFGGPQGMAVIENVIDRVGRFLKKDPADIRRRNFYGPGGGERNATHYGQPVENNRLFMIAEQLLESSAYAARRKAADAFNASSEFLKKGLAITPVKFGISFTTSFLNQAGALVLVYTDGTILVNHGGTEMGQGLHTKMQQVAAAEFGVGLGAVKVNATNTSKVPNTSATAASAGADLNGMAVKDAVDKLKSRMARGVAEIFNERLGLSSPPGGLPPPPAAGEKAAGSPPPRGEASLPESLLFQQGLIIDALHPERRIPFAEAIPLLYLRQVPLSATGFYKTPGIGWDKERGWGKPFHYFAFGMAVTEVLLDTLTGGHTILRADILHDVGDSLNPGIDIGQVEGGYIQGVGWCTTEEIKWDAKGNLLTHSPDTYKIPSVQDIPREFRVALLQGAPNPDTIRRSKAVAEPPFMLSLSCWLALKDALSAVAGHRIEPDFSLPATNEVLLLSADALRKQMARRDGDSGGGTAAGPRTPAPPPAAIRSET